MRNRLAEKPEFVLRTGGGRDLQALLDLESRVFTTDWLSRRSFRNFLASPAAELIVGEQAGVLAGYALVLFRPRSRIACLYSIAVAPDRAGQGLGRALLAAAEEAAASRGCVALRLEVQVENAPAIARYQKSGFRLLGRRSGYYDNGGDAFRFEKQLLPRT
jgi:[ribosomal protein S18]-alanine N-acetyltransferase